VTTLLAQHAGLLLLGTTLLLALGGLATWVQRSPIHRLRLGELTLIGVLI